MAVKLLFNPSGTGIEPIVKTPTLVIAKKSGEKLGAIPSTNIRFECNLNSANTIDFKVYKTRNGIDFERWDEVKDFRLLWVKEWDMWFEMHVDTTQSNDLEKNVNCTSIGEAELSVIRLYNIEINTENDIDRADYVQTVLYNELNPDGSLLNRILEKAPHYTIKHVDASIANIQRTFTFDDVSIQDAFSAISEEIGCLFVLSQSSDDDGLPERGIYVYDLMSYCNACGHREDHFTTCPNCGSTNIEDGFGKDTGIFISNENIAKEITLTTDTDNVFNCFKLEAGDDDITSAIANLNPNGSDYIWYFPEHITFDMSDELSQKITDYNTDYSYYQTEYEFVQSETLLDDYNALIRKYSPYNDNLEEIDDLVGFNSSTDALYSAIDFELFLTSGLVPSIEMSDTDASEQASLLTASTLSPVAVTNLNTASHSTVNMNILSVAKTIVRPTYKVEIADSEYDSTTHVWSGTFTVTNYSYDDDASTTEEITITVTDDYKTYINQKMNNVLNRGDSTDYSVTELFNKTLVVDGDTFSGDFADEIKKYCLDMLSNFHNSCQSCLDVLVEEGISDSSVWSGQQEDLYNEFYQKYYQRLQALEFEINIRESEISLIKEMYTSISDERSEIQNRLNLKNYIGDALWKEFCSYRRESIYSNSNYISDGLNNSEVLQLAEDFLNVARSELIKSSTMQHSISSSLNNLLLYDGEEFKKLIDSFDVGNWLRIKIDGEIYQLRLIRYAIDFENLEEIDVEFSDVLKCNDSVSDIQNILKQASSMASTYQTVERQADKNSQTTKVVNTWFEDGLNATLTKLINNADSQTMVFNEHGFLMRSYDEISGNYSPEQLKIINSTLAVTDDNWVTTKTAIGKFLYYDPVTGELKKAYGINAETVIGRMILGQSLGIYNASNTLKFDANGLNITNGVNTFLVNPSSQKLFSVSKGNTDLLSFDENGDLTVKGNLIANTLTAGNKTSSTSTNNGLHIDSAGNLYAGGSNQVQISANGTFNFANGGIVYDGTDLTLDVSALTINGASIASPDDAIGKYIRYESSNGLMIADMTSGSQTITGATTYNMLIGSGSLQVRNGTNVLAEYGSSIKMYQAGTTNVLAEYGASIQMFKPGSATPSVTINSSLAQFTGEFIANSGRIGGFNITSTGNSGTSTDGGHFATNSIYIHSSDNSNEYEAGIKGDNTAGTTSFYVRKIASGGRWNSGEYTFYVTNTGKLYANNSEIRGSITATSFTAYGTNTSTTITIGDHILLSTSDQNVEPYIRITKAWIHPVQYAQLSCDKLTFSTNSSSITATEAGLVSNTSFKASEFAFANGNGIFVNGDDGMTNRFILRYSGSSVYLGAHQDMGGVETRVRGENIYLTCQTGGGIYFNATPTITSDETLKDIEQMDDRYVDFFNNLNPVAYKFKVGHRTHIGFGAQTVEKALLNSGLTTNDFAGIVIDKDIDMGEEWGLSPDNKTHFKELYSLRYEEFIALNTMMIQKLQKRIEDLERQLRG